MEAYVCWKKSNSQRFALKVFLPAHEGADHALNEIRVLRALGEHPRIIRLIDMDREERSAKLVLELCEGGQLFDRLVALGHYKERSTLKFELKSKWALNEFQVDSRWIFKVR